MLALCSSRFPATTTVWSSFPPRSFHHLLSALPGTEPERAIEALYLVVKGLRHAVDLNLVRKLSGFQVGCPGEITLEEMRSRPVKRFCNVKRSVKGEKGDIMSVSAP